MKTIVLDTSALLRLFVPDGPLPAGLEDAIAAAARSEAVLLLPETALAEAAQVLLKKHRAGFLSLGDASEILEAILDLPLETVPDRSLVAEALVLAAAHKLTVYDSLFLTLAQRRNADLLTADLDLKKAFKKRR
jgi:predicted nucleic acid-binding protein